MCVYYSVHQRKRKCEAEGMSTGIEKPICIPSSSTTTTNATADRKASPSEHPTVDAPSRLLWLASSGQDTNRFSRFAACGHEERSPRRKGKNLRMEDKMWIPPHIPYYENNHQQRRFSLAVIPAYHWSASWLSSANPVHQYLMEDTHLTSLSE